MKKFFAGFLSLFTLGFAGVEAQQLTKEAPRDVQSKETSIASGNVTFRVHERNQPHGSERPSEWINAADWVVAFASASAAWPSDDNGTPGVIYIRQK
jgi:hypothetical protein